MFGPALPQQPNREVLQIGNWRRFRLGVLTVEAVMPFWLRSFPNESLPADCIDVAKKLMGGATVEIDQIEQIRGEWLVHCDELVYENQDKQNDALVGYAALQILRIALWDNLYSDSLSEAATDDEVDPEDTDYAFSAAACWAGGTIWDGSSSPDRRLDFWRWWLTEAVPSAWLVQLPG